MKKSAQGFTLIELLIVVAIIGILSVIGFAVYTNLGAQAKTRNITRRADLDAISKALEVNKSTIGGYVVLGTSQFSNGVIPIIDPQGYEYCANTTVSTQPADPTASWSVCSGIPGGPPAPYSVVSITKPPAGTAWKICTWLEAETNPVKPEKAFCKLSAQ